jgi:hypothetical protein
MNPLSYYVRSKETWGDSELSDLKLEYETKEMSISQIADNHRRTPGCISYRLKSLGIIEHNTLARGYAEYKSSTLYKEAVASYQKDHTDNPSKKKTKISSKISEHDELITVLKEIRDVMRILANKLN